MAGETVLEVEGLVAGYGAAVVLQGVDLTVSEGELVSLVGSNGAGKSTLLRTISGLIRPQAGSIRFAGQSIAGHLPERIARSGLLHVPEGRRVFADQTTEDNLLLGAYRRLGTIDRTTLQDEVEEMFRRFPHLAERRRSLAGFLSGGEQQMLAIARALIGRPKLVMLDEPSLGLAPSIVEAVLDILVEQRRLGTTILLVEQLAEAALAIADRGYVLSHGRVVHSGVGREVLANDDVRRAYLGEEL
jgi:branched-chain amino acid transport system ATP-binding protein